MCAVESGATAGRRHDEGGEWVHRLTGEGRAAPEQERERGGCRPRTPAPAEGGGAR